MPEWAWPSNKNWRIWCVSRFHVNKNIKQIYKGGLHFTVICCTNKCIINERYIPEHQNKLNIYDLQNYEFFSTGYTPNLRRLGVYHYINPRLIDWLWDSLRFLTLENFLVPLQSVTIGGIVVEKWLRKLQSVNSEKKNISIAVEKHLTTRLLGCGDKSSLGHSDISPVQQKTMLMFLFTR